MKTLRHYLPDDKEVLTRMLRDEDVPYLEMVFNEHPTMVLLDNGETIGFFTLKTTHNIPMLQHFCIKQNKRNFYRALFLVKCFKKVAKELGFKAVIMNSNKDYLSKLIEWCFHVKPYDFTDTRTWYLVKI